MTRQPEQILEENLIQQLIGLSYQRVTITDEDDLLVNLKEQLEKHNDVKLTDKEFALVLNHLDKGNVFEKAKILRDKMQLTKENGESVYLEFMNQKHWCKNIFQVSNQVTVEGSYKNRYDVTLLINGLPLVQVELKRRGLELKEAFNQINRYQRHSYWAGHGLFQYVQLFVISNGENTKYYANNKRQSFKQTFYWSDVNNKRISQLSEFAEDFLEPCHLAKMITRYIVQNEAYKILMVLRPYQYFATEALIERVKNSTKNAYIWHTTGSGKTLTSFKASQVIMNLPDVDKVVFVVDRKDLDYQTTKEFNAFSKGSVDGTDNTNKLVEQFTDGTKLIVTTIQKLNNAISNKRYLYRMDGQQDKRIVFIFDECHRSQFGDTHKKIVKFFTNHQLFGFTGTPIFAENAFTKNSIKHTTAQLFGKCLHKYVITDAIRDENVLKFSVEYIGKYKKKESGDTFADIEVEGIDTKELLESESRLEKIADYILNLHNRKTHGKTFTGMFCVSSIDTLIKYYDILKKRKDEGKHNLKIATVFSYGDNVESKIATGIYEDDFNVAAENDEKGKHYRENLDEYIEDYNQMFDTKFSTKDSQSFYNYYNDISKRVKMQQIDILLVVNMFLTGFDSPTLNTLYVDKNLKFHGLLQAYSRTNRILNEQKSQGNIVCFRNLKKATDDSIALFSNKDAKEEILLEPYEEYVRKFNAAYGNLLQIAPTVNSVDNLPSEDEELEFIKAFRALMRLKNILVGFVEFSFDDLAMNEQTFESYKSKYLDLFEKVKTAGSKEKDSILNDIDFELELIVRDEINVAYILKLLANLKDAKLEDREQHKKRIIEHLAGEARLRSKKELIEKFIAENLPHIEDTDDIPEAFDVFWKNEQKIAFKNICTEENLIPVKLEGIIEKYLFTERKPLREDIVSTLQTKPKIRERKTIVERVTSRIYSFVDTFISGMAG